VSIEVLLVDKDDAFAAILTEGLQTVGEYLVTSVTTGQAALDHVSNRVFDVFIVDTEIPDMEPQALVHDLRQQAPGVPVIVIPFFGAEMPPELTEDEVQGILPKPFFVDDLPSLMANILGRGAAAADEPTAVASEQAAPTTADAVKEEGVPLVFTAAPTGKTPIQVDRLRPILKDLSRELSAEAVLVMTKDELIAWAGTMEQEAYYQQLAGQVAETVRLSARTAAFLGEPSGGFDQTLYEGSRFRLLSLRLSPEPQVFLCLALSSSTPLGTVRYRTRQAAEEIVKLLS
jgi:CheY-like chemotaxis protein